MSKIRVLHVVQSMETGGLENGIVNLVNHSNNDEFIVDILCLRARGELADRITNPNSQVFFDGNQDQSKLIAIKKVYRQCKLYPYDIVHSHGYATMLASYIGATIAGCPYIINGEHGTLYHNSRKEILIQRFLFNRMKLNLSVSQVLTDTICQLFSVSQHKFQTIINGVDTEKFIPEQEPQLVKQKLQNELGLTDNNIVIGSVGRLVAVKNYPSLIKAMALVKSEVAQAKLLLAGEGAERAKLESLISDLELTQQVILLGRRDDVPDLMKLYDIFVLPSFSEGLSNTLLESMASGTPVVASKVGGNSEIVAEGRSGYLYDSDDVQGLAKILIELTKQKDNCSELGQQARKHIENNFSIATMVKHYEDTYQTLVLTQGQP